MLPNLLIIGAAKCGTTSLHQYLDQHPAVSMSREKELNFFVPEKSRGHSRDWYESQFDAAAPVRGESSPAYTAHPTYAGAPERIHALIPDVRLIYLVRDPIERVVSHYLHRLLAHPEMGTLDEALADPALGPRLMLLSRYWSQLELYLRHFDARHILVVDSDDLRRDRHASLARVFDFLGVDSSFRSPEFKQSHNPSPQMIRSRSGLTMLKGMYGALGAERAHALVSRSPGWMKAPFRHPIERPAVTGALRDRLVEEFAPEVERLRRHSGLHFRGWSI